MIKAKFEKCKKHERSEFFTKEYHSLKALEDDIFSMVKCDYVSGLQFPEMSATSKISPIGIFPLGTYCQYKITEITAETGDVLFLSGAGGESVLTAETGKWISGCMERQQPPRWFREGFRPATGETEIAEILDDESAVYFSERDNNMRILMRVAIKDMYRAVAKLREHQRFVVTDAKYLIPLLEVNGTRIEKVHSLFMREKEDSIQKAVDAFRRMEEKIQVPYLTKQSTVELNKRQHLKVVV